VGHQAEVLAAAQAYPWCQPLQVLAALASKTSSGVPASILHSAAIATFSRAKLELLVQRAELQADTQIESATSSIDTLAAAVETFAPEKPVPIYGGLDEVESLEAETAVEGLQGIILSETMAIIYLKQGQTEKAKYILEQLSLRQPEKSAYFASLLQNQ
jgi:HAMP domain-containing protein